jgi:hypothetical protein
LAGRLILTQSSPQIVSGFQLFDPGASALN